ncbi:MAG: BrnT family toxin [Burkholderiaceae bacterium]
MRFTYDSVKSERNVAERGIAFDLAESFDWSAALIVEDTRNDYPEPRYQALGLLDERLHMLVFTPRDGALHVISLRRANQRERKRYDAQTKT